MRGGAASLFLGGAGRAWRRQQRPDALLRDGKQRPRLREMALLLLLVPFRPLARGRTRDVSGARRPIPRQDANARRITIHNKRQTKSIAMGSPL